MSYDISSGSITETQRVEWVHVFAYSSKKDMKSGKLSEQDTRSRLEEVEAIAKRLSIKYGV